MRLERLVIGSGEHTLSTDFHPGLTVIGGLSPSTREALAGELIDALAGARPGVHLEVHSGGRSLTVFRPESGRHRVIDTDSVRDVTHEHLGPDGEIDLFAAAGTDRSLARRTIRLTRDDLVLESESDAWIARLAAADQETLWDTAMRCRASEHLLEQASTGASMDDAPVVREIEERHAALVAATDSYERVRLISLTIGTIGALGAIGMMNLEGPAQSLPFLLTALFGLVLGLKYRRSVDDAARAERSVLRQAGADDYSTFHYERVSALLDTDHERRAFVRAVGDHRRAMTAWGEVAGPVPLPFAMDHESEIRAAAQQLHERLGAHRSDGVEPALFQDVAAELTQAILSRVRAVRALTSGASLPLIVDDPFDGLDVEMKRVLLDILAAQAGNLQVIVVTADQDVVRWAHGEEGEGRLSLTGPTVAEGAIAAPAG